MGSKAFREVKGLINTLSLRWQTLKAPLSPSEVREGKSVCACEERGGCVCVLVYEKDSNVGL